MATLILGAVGSYFGGPIGGFLGSALGSYIDSAYLMPALFPRPKIEGPRIDDKSVQLASEGSPMRWAVGPLNRSAGTVIWRSDLKYVKEEKKVGSSGSSQKFVTYQTFVDVAIHIADAERFPVNAIRKIWADGKLIWDGTTLSRAGSLTFYDGSQTEPDPIYEAVRGVGHTPAFMGSAYAMIGDLSFSQNNNHIPLIEFLIEQVPDCSCAEAISTILTYGGFEPTEFDGSRIPYCFKGMVVNGPQVLADVLNPVFIAYGLTAYEENDKLVVVPRGAEDTYVLTEDQLSAHEEGAPDSTQWPIDWEDRSDRKILSNVQVRFVSKDLDLQAGSERQFRATNTFENTVSMDIPITMDSAEARALARRLLWQDEVTRFSTTFSLPPSYIWLHEGSVLRVTRDGITYDLFVQNVKRGDNYLVQVEAVVQIAEVFTQRGVSSGSSISGTLQPPPATTGWVVDCPALTADQYEDTGVYIAICNTVVTDKWVGAACYVSSDDVNYVWVESLPVESTLGTVTSFMDSGPTGIWDDTNVIEVTLVNGALTSCTVDECLLGKNRAAIRTQDGDWEVIGFVNASLTATGTYQLSKLLRGLRGTEHLVGSHAPGDAFILMVNDGSIVWGKLGIDSINTTRYFKLPSRDQLLSEATKQSVKFAARTAKCASPVHLTVSLDTGTNDLNVSWVRRSRKVFLPFSTDIAPFCSDELPERYEIEAWDGYPDGTLKRTFTSPTPSVTYTSAQQDADFGGAYAGTKAVRFVVYQMSSLTGRGVPSYVEFIP